MVRKLDGTPRVCLDYRRLNQVMKTDTYPIPRTQDCLDALSGATIFSIGDSMAVYHQAPVREEDIPKTAFITKYGLYEFTTMSMGLKNAPVTYQGLMELALAGLNWVTSLIYLDDVIVFG